MRTPQEIVADLAKAYSGWKDNEKDKNTYRDEFFDAATNAVEPEENIVVVYADSEEKALELATKYYPALDISDEIRPHPDLDGAFEIIATVKPEFVSFSFEHDGKVWSKQIASGSAMLDDERLLEEDPTLWLAVTELPNQDFLLALFEDDDEAYEQEKIEHIERVGEKFGISRQLKPLDRLDPEILAQLKPYIYQGKPTIKLPAPKKVTDG